MENLIFSLSILILRFTLMITGYSVSKQLHMCTHIHACMYRYFDVSYKYPCGWPWIYIRYLMGRLIVREYARNQSVGH